jgi:hypothetical protein
MQIDLGYGYTFTLLTAWIIQLFNLLGICNQADSASCQFLFYKLVIIVSLLGLLSLAFLLIEKSSQTSLTSVYLRNGSKRVAAAIVSCRFFAGRFRRDGY